MEGCGRISRRAVVKAAGASVVSLGMLGHLEGFLPAEAGAAGTPVRGGALRFGVDLDPVRTDPVNGVWMDEQGLQIYERIVGRDEQGNYVPFVAESWEVSGNGRTWTFKLRGGRTFQNGDPLNAQAVKWFFDTIRDPKNGHPQRSYYVSIEAVEAPDDATVVFRLSQPDSNLIAGMSYSYGLLLEPALRQKLGDDYGKTQAVGSGPFVFREWVPGDHVTIERWEKYQGGPTIVHNRRSAYLDRIIYRYIAEPATRSVELETGNLDVLRGPAPQDVARLKANAKLRVSEFPESSVLWIGFNLERPALQNTALRREIYRAINREALVKSVLAGHGRPAYSFVPPQDPAYLSDAERVYPYDPAVARTALAQMGVRPSSPLELQLVTYATAEHSQVAQILQAQLAPAGIRLKIDAVDRATQVQRRVDGKFDLFMFKYQWDSVPDIMVIFFHSKNIPRPNSFRYRNVQVDALFNSIGAAKSLADRQRIYRRIQSLLLGDLPAIPLYTPNTVYAMSERVKGFTVPKNSLYAYMQDVWLER